MLELSLEARIEAVLFAAPEPLSSEQVAKACRITLSQAEHALRHLERQLSGRGIMLQETGGLWQLGTRPEAASDIERHIPSGGRSELSRSSLETLAVVVFQGPVSQRQIETVRGVSSDQSLRSLLGKGLIQEVNRPGQAVHYAASHRALEELGLSNTGQLAKAPHAD